MRAIVNTKELIAGLEACAPFASSKIKPVLECVRIECDGDRMTFGASSLDKSILWWTSQVQIESKGAVAVHCRKMLAAVRGSESETIVISVEGSNLKLLETDGTFLLPTIKDDEFPVIQKEIPEGGIRLTSEHFRAAIARTIFAAGESEKFAMNGCAFEAKSGKLGVFAADGYQLAWSTHPCEGSMERTLVPAETLRIASKAIEGDVLVSKEQNHVVLSGDNSVVRSLLPEGIIAPYEMALTQSFETSTKICRQSIVSAISRASALGDFGGRNVGGNDVDIEASESGLIVRGKSADGESDIRVPSKVDGKRTTIRLGASRFISGLSAADADEVFIGLNGPLQAATIKSGTDYVFVQQPRNRG